MKRKKMTITFIILLFIILIVGVSLFRVLTGFNPRPKEALNVIISNNEEKKELQSGQELSIITWNIGYAGLGEESDFKVDGGENLFPESKKIVRKNLDGIISFLEDNPGDIYLLQELAFDSKLTRFINVLKEIKTSLVNYCSVFTPTVSYKNIPFLGNLVVGKGTYSIYKPKKAVRVCLPSENKKWLGFLKQHYNYVETRFPIAGSSREWVIVNVHLAAFDDGSARTTQSNALKEYMVKENKKGNFVIVGGDWNQRLTETDFPYTSDEKYLFWIRDMPENFAPDGWQWYVDKKHPTCRTLEKPYIKNENYTCIIDGFIVSPNVDVLEIKGFDLGFKYSDHQPVFIKVKAKNNGSQK